MTGMADLNPVKIVVLFTSCLDKADLNGWDMSFENILGFFLVCVDYKPQLKFLILLDPKFLIQKIEIEIFCNFCLTKNFAGQLFFRNKHQGLSPNPNHFIEKKIIHIPPYIIFNNNK